MLYEVITPAFEHFFSLWHIKLLQHSGDASLIRAISFTGTLLSPPREKVGAIRTSVALKTFSGVTAFRSFWPSTICSLPEPGRSQMPMPEPLKAPSTQCAAVRIHSLEMAEPPQSYVTRPSRVPRRAAKKGQSSLRAGCVLKPRITSYNVCYTKLLRPSALGRRR